MYMYTENVPCVVAVLRDTNKYTCMYGTKSFWEAAKKGSAVFSRAACPWAVTVGQLDIHVYMDELYSCNGLD